MKNWDEGSVPHPNSLRQAINRDLQLCSYVLLHAISIVYDFFSTHCRGSDNEFECPLMTYAIKEFFKNILKERLCVNFSINITGNVEMVHVPFHEIFHFLCFLKVNVHKMSCDQITHLTLW